MDSYSFYDHERSGKHIQKENYIVKEAKKQSKEVDIFFLYKSTILYCEKMLSNVAKCNQYAGFPRRNLMLALMKVRITIARFLSLYRWKKQTLTLHALHSNNNTAEYIINSVNALRSIINPFAISKIERNFNSICSRKKNTIDTNCDFAAETSLFDIFLQETPNSITNVFTTRNTVTIVYFHVVSVTLKVKEHESFKLVKFNYDSPIEIQEKIIKMYTELIKSEVKRPNTLLKNLHNIFQKLISYTKILVLFSDISSLKNPYKVKFAVKNGKPVIMLPYSYDPYNVFYVNQSTTNCDIFVTSSKPLYDAKTGNYKFVSFANPKPESLVAKMYIAANFTYIMSLTKTIDRAIKETDCKLTVEVHNYKIYVKTADLVILRLWRDAYTGELRIELCHDIQNDPNEVLNLICDGDVGIRKVLRTLTEEVALNSLLQQNVCVLSLNEWCESLHSSYIPCIAFSSCPYYRFILSRGYPNPQFQLLLDKEEYDSYSDAIADLSPRAAAVLLQMRRSKEHLVIISDGSITYSPDNVSVAKFTIKESDDWKISVTGNGFNPTKYKIYGKNFVTNSSERLLHMSLTVAHFIDLQEQLLAFNLVEASVLTPSELYVTYLTTCVPNFYITLCGFDFIGSTKYFSAFILDRNTPVDITASFIKFSIVLPRIQKILHSNDQFYKFIPFLSSSIEPFCTIQDVFLNKINSGWSIYKITEENWFMITCQRKFTIIIRKMSMGRFQVIIPNRPPSVILQLALRKIIGAKPRNNLPYSSLIIHSSQIMNLRLHVEEFFKDREALIKARFHSIRNDEENFPVFQSDKGTDWLKIQVSIKNGGLDINLMCENMTAIRLVSAFEPFGETRELMRWRLVFLSVISEKPEVLGGIIATIMKEVSRLTDIDWIKFVRKATFLHQPKIGVRFNEIKFSKGEFQIEVFLDGNKQYVNVESQNLKNTNSVKDFRSFNLWITSLLQ